MQTPQYAENNALDGDLWVGITGLLFSPGKSLFVYAPLLVLSVATFPKFWRKYRAEAVLVLFVAGGSLMLHAKMRSWYGSWGWGPRLFVPILPLLCIPALAYLPFLWRSRHGRAALLVIATWGLVLAFASMIGNYHYRMGVRSARTRWTTGRSSGVRCLHSRSI